MSAESQTPATGARTSPTVSERAEILVTHFEEENQQLSSELLAQQSVCERLKRLLVASVGPEAQQRLVQVEQENVLLRQQMDMLQMQLPVLTQHARAALRAERLHSHDIVSQLLTVLKAEEGRLSVEQRNLLDDAEKYLDTRLQLPSSSEYSAAYTPNGRLAVEDKYLSLDCCGQCCGKLIIL